ncbi:hypothetical protein MTR_3g027950 [Medicago truncatula]|uniref:Uncharacterized protein n=1 Tax=Medicago truncatula TaxID=3880 RepID=G7IWJ9_MEDTR|nr:hypothetical protein MTR_3g027950 [Medicago truncatula]
MGSRHNTREATIKALGQRRSMIEAAATTVVVVIRNGKVIIKLTHTSGGTGVRAPIIASGLTISAFCPLS